MAIASRGFRGVTRSVNRIRRLEFGALPKTISGKIRRVELRQAERARRAEDARGGLEFWEGAFPALRSGRDG